MQTLKYIVIGIPFAVMIFVICTLCLGPMFLAARDWFRKRKPTVPGVQGKALHVDIHNDYVQLPKGGHF